MNNIGVLLVEVSRIDNKSGREYDKTSIQVEVKELKRFSNGFSKIKVLNISGTLDPRQFKSVEKSIRNIVPTKQINFYISVY